MTWNKITLPKICTWGRKTSRMRVASSSWAWTLMLMRAIRLDLYQFLVRNRLKLIVKNWLDARKNAPQIAKYLCNWQKLFSFKFYRIDKSFDRKGIQFCPPSMKINFMRCNASKYMFAQFFYNEILQGKKRITYKMHLKYALFFKSEKIDLTEFKLTCS